MAASSHDDGGIHMTPTRCAPLCRSRLVLWLLGCGLLLLVLSLAHSAWANRAAGPAIAARAALVAALDLTDLALFTEARYTRHPSQADLHSAFQDHPMALDHFPSGALVPAPAPGWR